MTEEVREARALLLHSARTEIGDSFFQSCQTIVHSSKSYGSFMVHLIKVNVHTPIGAFRTNNKVSAVEDLALMQSLLLGRYEDGLRV